MYPKIVIYEMICDLLQSNLSGGRGGSGQSGHELGKLFAVELGGESVRVIILAPCFCVCLKFSLIKRFLFNLEGEKMKKWKNVIDLSLL